jgi:hypothetical protein
MRDMRSDVRSDMRCDGASCPGAGYNVSWDLPSPTTRQVQGLTQQEAYGTRFGQNAPHDRHAHQAARHNCQAPCMRWPPRSSPLACRGQQPRRYRVLRLPCGARHALGHDQFVHSDVGPLQELVGEREAVQPGPGRCFHALAACGHTSIGGKLLCVRAHNFGALTLTSMSDMPQRGACTPIALCSSRAARK